MTGHCIVYSNLAQMPKADEQTAAYRLFNHSHQCMVQQMFTMDAEVAAQWGTPTTGDERLDRDMRNEWVPVRLSAVQMTEYMARGAGIIFQDAKVAAKVYLDIIEHLRDWIKAFEVNPNLRRAPLDDLRAFDELAGAVYRYAMTELKTNEDDSGYGAFLARAMRRGRRLKPGVAEEGQTAAAIGTYRPMSDVIATKLAKRLGH